MLKKQCAVANFSLFTLHFSLKSIIFAHRMQKKDIIINVVLAVLALVLLWLCISSIIREVQTQEKKKEVVNNVSI